MFPRRRSAWVLPVILLAICALFVLTVSMLLAGMSGRRTARWAVDSRRAELAADAGLELLRATINRETGNDHYVVLQSESNKGIGPRRESPHVFIAQGRAENADYAYRYVPLFSARSRPPESAILRAPDAGSLLGLESDELCSFEALPYLGDVQVAWLPVRDARGRVVARFAYWVEDLQGRIDPMVAGNCTAADGTHAREGYPFPASGLNAGAGLALDQIALFAIAADADDTRQGTVGKSLIDHRSMLLTPGSGMAAAGLRPPLSRDSGSGQLNDLSARAIEETLGPIQRGWEERAELPFAVPIPPDLAGTARLNLNALLARPDASGVDLMADLIRRALPEFEDRKGGFPEDYVKTLAANALDYADVDSAPRVSAGHYRGLDCYPLMSEIALQVNYLGMTESAGRHIMGFRMRLFMELCNPNSQACAGKVRLSYEVALPMDSIGSGVGGEAFDSPVLLDNPQVSTHDLTRIGGRYWTREVDVGLEPNQYRAYDVADVVYRLDVGPVAEPLPASTPFSLNEAAGASGISMQWNGTEVDRAWRILRQAGLIYSERDGLISGGFRVGTGRSLTKAALPGHVYDDYPNTMYFNMGDPRITQYLRKARVDENGYPENTSPNRRNVRLEIYQNDTPERAKTYARVLPSEWPDGGHNAAVGQWSPGFQDTIELTDPRFAFAYDAAMGQAAPQRVSNAGRFFSVTELGHVFDPVMHAPAYPDAAETASLRSKGKIPGSKDSWPEVSQAQPGPYYGGGNSLRIGRPEHPCFDRVEHPQRAAWLLELFHTGMPHDEQASAREGPLVQIQGHVNVNTATRDALRMMAAGKLRMDPLLSRRTSPVHVGAPLMAAPVEPLRLTAPAEIRDADRIADALLRHRPFASLAAMADVRGVDGKPVFGQKAVYAENRSIEWSDAACEEVFGRIYQASTLRSRNFRVWTVGQALGPESAKGVPGAVLAEVRKVHTLFVDPGERAADGSIVPEHVNTRITSSHDF